ncbi:MAG: TonB-dependent receptor [Gammaproteobacteria bacterium]|nr:MAG: TonB-dependent receptor [Gammaproteobacteria bacterium]
MKVHGIRPCSVLVASPQAGAASGEGTLTEIVVSGTRLPEAGSEGPIPVGVVTRADMEQGITGDEIGVVLVVRWLQGRLETGTRLLYAAAQKRLLLGPNQVPETSSHQLVDLFASWLPTPSLREDLRVDNLTDEAFRRHLSRIKDPGRSVRLQVSWRGGV